MNEASRVKARKREQQKEDDLRKFAYTVYVTKCGINDEGGVEINYKLTHGGDLKNATAITLKSPERAAPDYYYMMGALRDCVHEIIELPASFNASLHIRSVKFDYVGDDQIMCASISCEKTLSYSENSFEFSTPMKPSFPLGKAGKEIPQLQLPDRAVNLLEGLLTAAEEYIEGVREQPTLAQQPTIAEEIEDAVSSGTVTMEFVDEIGKKARAKVVKMSTPN